MSGVGVLRSSDPLFRQALLFSLAAHLATLAWVQAPVWDATPPLSVIDARLEPLPEPAVQPPELTAKPLLTSTPVQTQVPTPLPELLPVVPSPAVAVPALVSNPVAVSLAPAAPVQPVSRPTTPAVVLTATAPAGVSEVPRVIPDGEWYPVRKLDTLPKRLGKAVLVYPDSARRHGVTGSVKVKLQVNTLGEVEGVEIVSAQPEGVFEDAARTFFKAARYQPPQREGRPVRAVIEERVSFTLRDDF